MTAAGSVCDFVERMPHVKDAYSCVREQIIFIFPTVLYDVVQNKQMQINKEISPEDDSCDGGPFCTPALQGSSLVVYMLANTHTHREGGVCLLQFAMSGSLPRSRGHKQEIFVL